MDFDDTLIEKCADSVREHIGEYGFIIVLVKSREEQQIMAATNLVPDIAIAALQHGANFFRQLDADAQEMVRRIAEQNAVDARRLGDGNPEH